MGNLQVDGGMFENCQAEVPLVPARSPSTGAWPDGRTSGSKTLGRVLHVINGEHYSGAERVQDLLAARLPELGFEIDFACVKPGRFPQVRRSVKAGLIELPMRSRYDLRVVWSLIRVIRERNYKLLHAHTPRTALVGGLAALAARIPWVYHVHSPASRDTTDRLRNRMNAASEWLSLLSASRLITVSESLAQHMRLQGFSCDCIHVVPNGVPQAPAVPDREADRHWTLGTVALFRPRKGLEVLLDAIALLRQQQVAVELRAVGPFETPQYQQQLEQHVQRLGLQEAVHWTGFCDDVDAQLRQMDLFVLPSLFGEGMPMVVLEAMAVGLPVVATRVEGIPEVIRDGREGVIAAPGDPFDLAHQISRIILGQLDWRQLSVQAQQRHAARFSDAAMAEGVARVYRELVS